MVVTFLPGRKPPKQPLGWADGRCLSCCRSAAVAAALADLGPDPGRGEAYRAKIKALTRVELRRDAGRSDSEVAKSMRCPPRQVALARAELLAAGEIERRNARPPRQRARAKSRVGQGRGIGAATVERWEQVEAMLRADPLRPDRAIARDLGTTPRIVSGRRRALEEAGAIPKTRAIAQRRELVEP